MDRLSYDTVDCLSNIFTDKFTPEYEKLVIEADVEGDKYFIRDKSSRSDFDECNLGDDDEFFYYDFLTSSASNNKNTYINTISCTIDDEHLSSPQDEQDDDTTNEPDE
ncbi:unnamed protein product [Rotaria sordida]|uniref:Uncharacterized protein n=2 Tax=Rotaria sordida TaxID=392033 RepID=A0A814L6D6_9BILA|nr:unnamed protein product [Rotaria sordida]